MNVKDRGQAGHQALNNKRRLGAASALAIAAVLAGCESALEADPAESESVDVIAATVDPTAIHPELWPSVETAPLLSLIHI